MKTDDFLHHVVTLANETLKGLTGRFSEVQAIVDESEIVVAVWQDLREPDRVGRLLIKGHHNLRDIMADGAPVKRKIAAIPCISYEQAEALRQVIGETDRRH